MYQELFQKPSGIYDIQSIMEETLEKIRFVDVFDTGSELKEKIRLWRNKERIRKCMLNQHIISREEHQQWLQRLEVSNTQKLWVVFWGESPLGIVNLSNNNSVNLTSEWGFYIGEESFLGKGLGRKMVCKFLMLYFDSMKYNELITKVLSGNDKALSLYHQFKFQQIGTEKFSDNEDVIIFSFSSENWNTYKEEIINACN
jgi:UDP-4-amino-4,6-dideoxy-N-acetyl-beta-L-altrosamine N-acetyltransferase